MSDEENTGHLIVSEFKRMKKDVMAVPAVLCKNHGPFSWGKDAKEAVHNAVVLEQNRTKKEYGDKTERNKQ